MPLLSNPVLALLGGAILLAVGLARARQPGKRIDFIYVFFGAILIIVGFLRELIGSGKLFGITVLETVQNGGWYQPNGLFLLAPSAFFIIGLLIWALRSWKPEQQEKE